MRPDPALRFDACVVLCNLPARLESDELRAIPSRFLWQTELQE